MEVTPEGLARFFDVVLPHMNEVQRRVVAGAASEMLGRGGKTAVAAASGMSRNTVIKAEAEVATGIEPSARLRAPGGGDKPLIDKQPDLLEALDELVHPETRGHPMSLLRWTSKSSTNLAADLMGQGFAVSSRTVLRLLHRLGYSLQPGQGGPSWKQWALTECRLGCPQGAGVARWPSGGRRRRARRGCDPRSTRQPQRRAHAGAHPQRHRRRRSARRRRHGAPLTGVTTPARFVNGSPATA